MDLTDGERDIANKNSRRKGSSPTISDVAAHAGVSAMTVSRVINGNDSVSSSTRSAVNEAIAALSYAPNPAARSLAGADQIRVGILYSNPSAAYLSEFLVGGLDRSGLGAVQLMVEKCEAEGSGAEVARRLIASGIDGLLLPPPLCDSAEVIAALAASDTPGVGVATANMAKTISTVSIDDQLAAHSMTAHLVALGHRRIGFITGNPNQTASAQRTAGYRAALDEAGIASDGALIADGLFTYQSGMQAAITLLDLADPPSAIFASNDDMAAAAVAVAHRRGLEVPGDLSVCGFDDTALATTIWPELTTIRQPIADMAHCALDVLLDEIRSRRAGKAHRHRRLLLDFRLIRRYSDAAPGGRPLSA